ncbi:MAG: hypothetical protein LBH40_06480 [Alphaproteobacteria bacterium]|jgi:hypothetical protein|nr:hypothetical protein [Alphaproteobacteria bacterium]
MKKLLVLFSLLFLIYSCGQQRPISSFTSNNDSSYIPNYNMSKEDVLKNYADGSLQIYKKEEIQNLLSEIENDTKDIITLSKADVLNVAGSPYLIKNEVVIELWQYRNPFCILNIIWDNSLLSIKDVVSYDNDLKKIDNKKCFLNTVQLNSDSKKES